VGSSEARGFWPVTQARNLPTNLPTQALCWEASWEGTSFAWLLVPPRRQMRVREEGEPPLLDPPFLPPPFPFLSALNSPPPMRPPPSALPFSSVLSPPPARERLSCQGGATGECPAERWCCLAGGPLLPLTTADEGRRQQARGQQSGAEPAHTPSPARVRISSAAPLVPPMPRLHAPTQPPTAAPELPAGTFDTTTDQTPASGERLLHPPRPVSP